VFEPIPKQIMRPKLGHGRQEEANESYLMLKWMSLMTRRLVILSSILVLDVLLLRSSETGIQRRRKKFFAETNADPRQAGFGPENNSDSKKLH
jgi:hypothetical protein